MLEHCKSAKERWGGVSNIIDRWLQERQLLLVSYCSLAEIPSTTPSPEQITEVCQLLVDYVSAGHFEVYDQLVRSHHHQHGSVETGRSARHSFRMRRSDDRGAAYVS
jgi:regulator of sigma D